MYKATDSSVTFCGCGVRFRTLRLLFQKKILNEISVLRERARLRIKWIKLNNEDFIIYTLHQLLLRRPKQF
jgi:hypothetical protein